MFKKQRNADSSRNATALLAQAQNDAITLRIPALDFPHVPATSKAAGVLNPKLQSFAAGFHKPSRVLQSERPDIRPTDPVVRTALVPPGLKDTS